VNRRRQRTPSSRRTRSWPMWMMPDISGDQRHVGQSRAKALPPSAHRVEVRCVWAFTHLTVDDRTEVLGWGIMCRHERRMVADE
jgi:hypothetical protein